ncbi:hypothetical protein RLOC_00010517, partial [Lonchura striata]
MKSPPAAYAAPDWYSNYANPAGIEKPWPAQRKSEAVNFSKLITNGYGTDLFQQCTGWGKKIEKHQKIVSTLK